MSVRDDPQAKVTHHTEQLAKATAALKALDIDPYPVGTVLQHPKCPGIIYKKLRHVHSLHSTAGRPITNKVVWTSIYGDFSGSTHATLEEAKEASTASGLTLIELYVPAI